MSSSKNKRCPHRLRRPALRSVVLTLFVSTTLYFATIAFRDSVEQNRKNTVAQKLEQSCANIEACISIHVFVHNRIEATKLLLQSLESSDYRGYLYSLALVIHVDGPATRENYADWLAIRDLVQEFRWTHGPTILDVDSANHGLKESWLTSWIKPRPNDIMIAFEDDVIPSPLYFQWLLKVLTEYNLFDGDKRDPLLLGISLAPMRLDEISYPFRPWMTHEKINANYPVFLHAVPSSWGVAYFGGPWLQFLEFVQVRMAKSDVDDDSINMTGRNYNTRRGDPNLWIPNSRTNNWVRSWKKYMVDFAYGRGAYTMYPNIANSSGIATSVFTQGEHVPGGSYINPRIAPLARPQDVIVQSALPSYGTLPLVDMHGENITRRDLSRRGDDFIKRISDLGEHYSTITQYWKRPCLLDRFVDPTSLPRVQASKNHYILVAPQMGFSNQLISILHSSIWAHTLERTLVLPHIIWPRASDRTGVGHWVSFHELFTPTGLDDPLPGLELVYADIKVLRTWRPTRIIAIEPRPLFDELDDSYLSDLGWSTRSPKADLVQSTEMLNTTDKLYQTLGSCNDRVMVLDGLYKNPQRGDVSETQRRAIWRALFSPSGMVQDMIAIAREAIAAGDLSHGMHYGCMHIRQGDFARMCSASPTDAPWLTTLYKMGRRCHVSPDDVAKRANSLGLGKVLIISDNPANLTTFTAGMNATVWTSADIFGLVQSNLHFIRPNPSKHLIEAVSAVTEQHICAQADRLIINAFSTFSRSVMFNRPKFAGIQFW